MKAAAFLSLCTFLFSTYPSARAEDKRFPKDPETLVFSFQKQKKPEDLQKAAEVFTTELAKNLGKKVEVLVPTTYSISVQGLISSKVHVAYMDSLPFLLAKREVPVEIIAVERRNGRTDYDSLIVVKQDSQIKSLADLKGKRMAFTSQTSTSGYLFPFFRVLSEGLIKEPKDLKGFFSEILYAGGYDRALQAVSSGQVDAAAFSDYVIEGSKANLYGSAEERQKIRVLARTAGVPTHLIAVSSSLSEDLRAAIQKSLLSIAKANADLLSSVYGAAELVIPESQEGHVAQTVRALKATGIEVKEFVK